MGRRHAPLLAGLLLVLLVACGGSDSDTDDTEDAATSAAPRPAPGSPTPEGPAGLALDCAGHGHPVIVLLAGLDTGAATFTSVAERLSGEHRVCTHDRAGIGASPALATDAPDPWPGSAADALAETLAEDGERPPYVVVGWSYGGLVAQAFADRHGDVLGGLVLEDSSVREQFVDRIWTDISWQEGGRTVDTERTVAHLSDIDLGDRPLAVLTQDALTGAEGRAWHRYQNRLAGASRDAVHVLAVGSGHQIHEQAEDLVVAVVGDVASAVGAGRPLGGCPDSYARMGGRCLS